MKKKFLAFVAFGVIVLIGYGLKKATSLGYSIIKAETDNTTTDNTKKQKSVVYLKKYLNLRATLSKEMKKIDPDPDMNHVNENFRQIAKLNFRLASGITALSTNGVDPELIKVGIVTITFHNTSAQYMIDFVNSQNKKDHDRFIEYIRSQGPLLVKADTIILQFIKKYNLGSRK